MLNNKENNIDKNTDLCTHIDDLKQYIDSEICKRCDDMKKKLDEIRNILLDN